ncbi:MAG: hypothetical protein P8189_32425 [Anaerolineae bacterium]
MGGRRDLVLANALALLLLLIVVLVGWWQEAAFGLAVVVILDLAILLRGRQVRAEGSREGTLRASEGLAHGPLRPPEGGPVRQVPRSPEEGLVLWVTDQRTLGDHGLLLFPGGRTEAR